MQGSSSQSDLSADHEVLKGGLGQLTGHALSRISAPTYIAFIA